jgi:5-methylcytosine-specific restriction protein A
MFKVGQTYNRQEIHRTFGGQHQTGISTPSGKPYIFLFTGGIGEKRGYVDGWTDDETFSYSGQGQQGDMEFQGGNLAIRDHAANGKDLHLFENVGGGSVKYVGQMIYAGYQVLPAQPDRDGNPRRVIQFHLLELSAVQDESTFAVPGQSIREPSERHAGLPSLDTRSDRETSSRDAKVRAFARSVLTRTTVLSRANGHCESCGHLAPFQSVDGQPYLELHHVLRKTDGGPDAPERVVALCPNCHRRAHKSRDSEQFNAELKERLKAITQTGIHTPRS